MGTYDILSNCNYYEWFRKREIAVYLVCVIWRHTMIIIEAIFVFNCVTLPIFLWFMIFFPASSSVFNFIYTYPILFLLLPCFSFSPSFSATLFLFFSQAMSMTLACKPLEKSETEQMRWVECSVAFCTSSDMITSAILIQYHDLRLDDKWNEI